MQDKVLILHGLARTARSMKKLAETIEQAGYEVLNFTYPSREYTIEELAAWLLPKVEEHLETATPLHFVSHSMGGLVGRELMSLLPEHNWQSAVFIAPPNQGSQVARTLSSHPMTQSFFQWFYGPAGQQVAGEIELPLPLCPFGVIAGTKKRALVNPTSWISHNIFPDDQSSDGTVAVHETKLDKMVDFAELALDHTTIMNHPQIHRFVLHFFQHHAFPKD